MPDNDIPGDQTPVLEQIGTLLRETRESKGITLDTVQEETKIRSHYLLALELGKKELLPGDVYLKGFLKNYANFLGLPGEELVKRYNQSQDREHKAIPERTDYRLPTEQRRPSRILVPTILLVVLTVAGFWLTNKAKGPTLESVQPPLAENKLPPPFPPDVTNPDVGGKQEDGPQENIVQTELDTATEIVYKVTADSLQVELKITNDRCWVAFRSDDLTETADTLTAGSSRTLSAKDKLWLRAGNPGVLDITVNGVHLGAAGQAGQPRNIIIERRTL